MPGLALREISLDVPPIRLETAAFDPATVDPKQRTAEIRWYSGAAVLVFDWERLEEIELTMSLEPGAVRLERMRSGRAPLLNSHRSGNVADVLGVFTSAELTPEGGGTGTVKFSSRADVQPILQDVAEGVLVNVSMGFRVHAMRELESETGSRRRFLATDWEPFEGSLVPIGKDPSAHVLNDQGQRELNACRILAARELGRRSELKDNPTMPKRPTEERASADPAAEPQATVPAVENGSDQHELAEEERNRARVDGETAGRRQERERVLGIQRAVAAAGLDAALAQELVEQNVTLDQARARVLERLAARQEQELDNAAVPSVRMIHEERESIREGITSALLHRWAPRRFPLGEQGRPYVGRSMLEYSRILVERNRGIRTDGMGPGRVAELALHGTSDFPNILANVAGKVLRPAFENAPRTFLPLVRETTARDFKPVSRVQLGNTSSLEKIGANGEVRRGTVGESAETYFLSSYGLVLALTRQAIVNDDLDAFTRIPQLMGAAAAELEGDLFWALITGNVVMGDEIALFDADHGNLSDPALDLVALSEMRAAMKVQRGIGGRGRLNIAPAFLAVPAALETTGDRLVTQITPALAENVNVFAGRLQVISEARLDDDSTTAWYGFASPDRWDVGELCYLEGQMGPEIVTREGFDVQGTEIKIVHDVALAMVDYRGAWKSSGDGGD